MIDKLGLWVCETPGCPAIGRKAGNECPTHGTKLIREVYVRQSSVKATADLSKLFEKFAGSPSK